MLKEYEVKNLIQQALYDERHKIADRILEFVDSEDFPGTFDEEELLQQLAEVIRGPRR